MMVFEVAQEPLEDCQGAEAGFEFEEAEAGCAGVGERETQDHIAAEDHFEIGEHYSGTAEAAHSGIVGVRSEIVEVRSGTAEGHSGIGGAVHSETVGDRFESLEEAHFENWTGTLAQQAAGIAGVVQIPGYSGIEVGQEG